MNLVEGFLNYILCFIVVNESRIRNQNLSSFFEWSQNISMSDTNIHNISLGKQLWIKDCF